jgi:hypothetical protein
MNKLIIASAIFLLVAVCHANPVAVEAEARNSSTEQNPGFIDGLLNMIREKEARHIGHHHHHHHEESSDESHEHR